MFVLLAKYFIHKCKHSLRIPRLNIFLCDFNYFIKTLKRINNKKSVKFVKMKVSDIMLSDM